MDIVEQLRKRAGSLMPPTMDELYEAADEIERLRKVLENIYWNTPDKNTERVAALALNESLKEKE